MLDPTTIYGSTYRGNGRDVDIDPQLVIYADDAVQQLPNIVRKYTRGTRTLVLMDARTRLVAGADVANALRQADFDAHELIVPDPAPGKSPVCDDITFAALRPQCDSPDLIVTVGSGVINDLGKWLAVDAGIPYVSFATAASMNGYTSANIAPSINGIKTLERGNAPKAVLSTPAIIGSAPYEMTASGLGDVVAKSVSSIDWRINHLLFGDEYIPDAVDLISGLEPLYFGNPEAVRDREPKAIKALFDALMLTGVAMTMAGSSAPASGGEHLISHGLDMLSSIDGVPHDFHGRQVGIGTILSAGLYERLVELETPTISVATATDFSFWGPLQEVVRKTYAPKIERLEHAASALKEEGAWDRLRVEIRAMLRPTARIRDCLSCANAAYRPEHIGCTPERLLNVFEHCHEMRARFTVIDLAHLVGLMPSCAPSLIRALGSH